MLRKRWGTMYLLLIFFSFLPLQGPYSRDPLGRAEDPSVDWMFPQPRHLSFPGAWAELRAKAKQEQKYVCRLRRTTAFSVIFIAFMISYLHSNI